MHVEASPLFAGCDSWTSFGSWLWGDIPPTQGGVPLFLTFGTFHPPFGSKNWKKSSSKITFPRFSSTFLPWALGRGFPSPLGPPGEWWEDLSNNVFFENGLKTYIIGRSSPRASIRYRFCRKLFFLWRFIAIQRFWRFVAERGSEKHQSGGGRPRKTPRGDGQKKNIPFGI